MPQEATRSLPFLTLDRMLVHRSQVHPHIFIRFPYQSGDTNLCSFVEGGTVRVKRLFQEHNSVKPQPGIISQKNLLRKPCALVTSYLNSEVYNSKCLQSFQTCVNLADHSAITFHPSRLSSCYRV